MDKLQKLKDDLVSLNLGLELMMTINTHSKISIITEILAAIAKIETKINNLEKFLKSK